MSSRPLSTLLSVILAVAFIIPSAFFVAPQHARAFWGFGDVVFDVPTELKTAISAIQEVLVEAHSYTTMVAEYANYVNTYYLQPLAFVLSGNLMKSLTASVVGFVIGKANGTGIPQFVVDVRKSMQTVSDSQELALIKQINLTKSPFAYSIKTALNTDYLTKTSLAGFWKANMCTLSASSPNVPAYLAGDWSQGGVAAWFALTTQSQNNPYMLYAATQSQLANVVGAATGARATELNWGQGFMSWCGTTAAADNQQGDASAAYQKCMEAGGTGDTCQAAFEKAGGSMPSGQGVNPGDACTNSDGTPGTIQTPGTVIKTTLDKVLGGQQDEITRMGNVGPQINSILSDIATVMKTVNFASQILGGSSSGGLLNAGQPSGQLSGITPTRNSSGSFTSGYLGASNSQAEQTIASSSLTTAFNSDATNKLNMYQSAWSTIGAAASSTKVSVLALINTCTANAAAADPSLTQFISASTAQASQGEEALTTEINPVIAQANAAMVNTAPTSAEVTYAQQNVQSFGMATTSQNSVSLIVSATSLIDQMTVISANAQTLQNTVCTMPLSSINSH